MLYIRSRHRTATGTQSVRTGSQSLTVIRVELRYM